MMTHQTRNRKRQRGFVTLIWTCMMLFVIIPSVGLAIDAGVMYYIKSKLQSAVDGAALGAARSLNQGQSIPLQETAASETAVRYYHANFPNNWMGVTPVNDPTVTWPAAPPATAIINVQGDINAPTWFMRIIGVNSLHLTVIGQSSRRDVNLMLIIDRSTSLSDTGSCPTLAADAQVFVNSFSNNRDRLAMVTFGSYYNLDFAPNLNFQPALSNMLANLQCSGFTNAAAAFSTGYSTLKGLNDQNSLNVMVLFTDGIPNTITLGPAYGTGTAAKMPIKVGSSCVTAGTTGYSGVIAGDSEYAVTGGIFQATNSTYPAATPFPNDIALIGSNQGYKGGCSYPSNYVVAGTTPPFSNDIAYLPATDAFGNALATDILGGAGFPAATNQSGGHIVANDRQTIENAGINALDNAAQNARVDAAANNLPFIVYVIGLGNAPGGVNNALLERIANDPSSATHQAAYTTGLYMYSPDTAHLASAFATIASDILRISK
jgi:VWA domain-containing protein/putative Flp pilus-assembly TadE/G-like protein